VSCQSGPKQLEAVRRRRQDAAGVYGFGFTSTSGCRQDRWYHQKGTAKETMMKWTRIADALYEGSDEDVVALIQQALSEGYDANEVLNSGLLPGMDRVAEDFEKDILFVPEVLIAADAMLAGMKVLRPLLGETDSSKLATFVAGTVHGDIHDIGKKLVCIMLEGAGVEVIDLGKDTPPEKFVEAVKEYQPQAVLMSALLTTTMGEMRTVIDSLESEGLRDGVKVMIGGAPITQEYADRIGADGYAADAVSAVKLAKDLLKEWLEVPRTTQEA
jgi:5-methyltetrahydrofolate--homocysteine methyltransferase